MINNNQTPISVTEVTLTIKKLLATAPGLSEVKVRGELFSFKLHRPSGHIYFTLKDEQSQLSSVMFRGDASRLTFEPEEGMEVAVSGRIAFYEQRGTIQLYAKEMEPFGAGAAALAFEKLKAKLTAEGLFDENRKRQIPLLPSKVGIVTSRSGAALGDILDVMGRRFPGFHSVICHAAVQGTEAPEEIIKALAAIIKTDVDVVILARGGGSAEDLAAFNDEMLVRQVAAMPVPVVTGVGHEMDFTLVDFAADLRAPTPSAAAERVMPEYRELIHRLGIATRRLAFASRSRIKLAENMVQNSSFVRASELLKENISKSRIKLDDVFMIMHTEVHNRLKNRRNELLHKAGTLTALNPMSVLSRGFSVVFDENGVQKNTAPEPESKILVCFDDSAVSCDVKERIEDDKRKRLPEVLRRRYGGA